MASTCRSTCDLSTNATRSEKNSRRPRNSAAKYRLRDLNESNQNPNVVSARYDRGRSSTSAIPQSIAAIGTTMYTMNGSPLPASEIVSHCSDGRLRKYETLVTGSSTHWYTTRMNAPIGKKK
eukprot:Amastigsp_a1391_32.p4 type:complete len:122 gc:universal Amastigsp_a1391_32:391-756(+)